MVVVELDERGSPGAGGVDILEAIRGKGGVVFGGPEEGFGVWVIVADAGSGVGGDDAQRVHEGLDGGGFERGTVVAVKDSGMGACGDLFEQGSALDDLAGMCGVFFFPDIGGDDFAAEEVEDDIEFEEATEDAGGKPSDIPTPDLLGGGGCVGGWFFGGARGSCPAAVGELFGMAEDAVEGRFGSDITALVGEVDDDLSRG